VAGVGVTSGAMKPGVPHGEAKRAIPGVSVVPRPMAEARLAKPKSQILATRFSPSITF